MNESDSICPDERVSIIALASRKGRCYFPGRRAGRHARMMFEHKRSTVHVRPVRAHFPLSLTSTGFSGALRAGLPCSGRGRGMPAPGHRVRYIRHRRGWRAASSLTRGAPSFYHLTGRELTAVHGCGSAVGFIAAAGEWRSDGVRHRVDQSSPRPERTRCRRYLCCKVQIRGVPIKHRKNRW